MTNDEEKLVIENINMANDIAWKYYRKFGGKIVYEELKSSAYLGLTKAAKTFNSELNKTFSTYAYAVMRNEILIYFNAEKYNMQLVSLSEKIVDNIELQDVIASDIDLELDSEKKITVELLHKQINSLEDKYKVIMLYKLNGMTLESISKQLNMPLSQVINTYQRALNILRRKFNT